MMNPHILHGITVEKSMEVLRGVELFVALIVIVSLVGVAFLAAV